MDSDTIAALSTPLGRGGIAVIRISGKNTLEILGKISEKMPHNPVPRRAYHTFILEEGHRIDECMITFFKRPQSYTGEDAAEISIHSNPFIIEAVLNVIFKNNARPASAGEFTYRAFKNGKMDLIQAESVNELINAHSRGGTLMKFDNLEGKLSHLVKQLRTQLMELGIRVESVIEFAEDQFLEGAAIPGLDRVTEISRTIERILSHSRFNEILDRGLNIVIAGKVNVGKSSLFNHLLMEERSIISSIPGTTRDFIKEKVYIGGFPFEITDVAGINTRSDDEIEALGVKRSFEKIDRSDAVIFMLDASRDVDQTDLEIYESIRGKDRLVLVNKIDIVSRDSVDGIKMNFKDEQICAVSVKESLNLEVVFSYLKGMAAEIKDKAADISINHRQARLLEKLMGVLKNIAALVGSEPNRVEIVAEEIRKGIDIIGELTGRISADDILKEIFSRFCVGK